MAADSSLLSGNVVIGQSGGPTAVINQSLVGVVEALRGAKGIGKILGAENAVRGLIERRFIELQEIDPQRLDRIANTPSAALGSTRDKPDEAYCDKIFKVMAEQDVRYFFYIGGNDSSDTCRIVNERAKANNYELRAFHVPKTIDNDLVHNDHTPGFGSAARFVGCAFLGDNLDNRALKGVKINVIMGRHAGFLTAASTLAKQREDDGPHLVYVPEVAFDEEDFLERVSACYEQYGRCLIAVSEGIHDAAGTPIVTKLAEKTERDAHGNVQLSGTGSLGDFLAKLIKDRLEISRVRADTFGYLQRCFAGCVSPTDAQEARMAGRKAAEAALAGEIEGSVAIERVNDEPYEAGYRLIALSDVAAKTRTMDPKHLVDGCRIDPSFLDYLRPLVGPMPEVELLEGSGV